MDDNELKTAQPEGEAKNPQTAQVGAPAAMTPGILAAIAFAVLAVNGIISYVIRNGRVTVLTGILIVGYCVAAAALFMKRKDVLLIIGVGLLTAYNVYMPFVYFGFVDIALGVIEAAGYICLFVMVLSASAKGMSELNGKLERFWFAPAAALGGTALIGFIYGLLYCIIEFSYFDVYLLRILFWNLIIAAAVLFTGMEIFHPEMIGGSAKSPANGSAAAGAHGANARAAAPAKDPHALEKLGELDELRKLGAISDEEFAEKKAELLRRV